MGVPITDCKKGDTIFFRKPGDIRRIGTIRSISRKKGKLLVSYRIVRYKLGTPYLMDVTGYVDPKHVIGFGTPL